MGSIGSLHFLPTFLSYPNFQLNQTKTEKNPRGNTNRGADKKARQKDDE